jgi:hypothetical protein
MSLQEINTILLKLLGPLKQQEQPDGNLNKLEELLKICLTQDKCYVEWQFSLFPDPPDPDQQITREISDLAALIFADIPARAANEKAYWIRQRNFPFYNGPEGNLGNLMEPAFSFGPFTINTYSELYYDFFLIDKQLVFYTPGREAPIAVVFPHQEVIIPVADVQILLGDCSIWIDSRVLSNNTAPDRSFTGIRAKNCMATFSQPVIIIDQQRINIPPPMALAFDFEPDTLSVNNNEAANDAQNVTASLPDKVNITISSNNAVIVHAGPAKISLYGTTSSFNEGSDIKPDFNTKLNLVRIPLICNETDWGVTDCQSDMMMVSGKAGLLNSGWYHVLARPNDEIGLAQLGRCNTAGQLGLELGKGIQFKWEGLENGALSADTFFLSGTQGRLSFNYTHQLSKLLVQYINLWPGKSDAGHFSTLQCKPLTLLPGFFAADAIGFQYHRQYTEVKAKTDRPIASNGRRFDFEFPGITELTRAGGFSWFLAIAAKDTPDNPDETLEDKLNKTTSIALENALITVQPPIFLAVMGKGANIGTLTQGTVLNYLPIFRIIHTLPDPYISNQRDQEDIFDEANQFNTFPPRSAFLIATILWDNTEVKFDMQLAEAIRNAFKQRITVPDQELQNFFFNNFMHPCQMAYNNRLDTPLQNHPITQAFIGNRESHDYDPVNLVGAFGFLQWIPGNLCLVDVSGRASRMGIAFSSAWSANVNERNQILINNTGYTSQFTYQIQNLELVSSGRLVRAFTLPHIQWEPVTNIPNPNLTEAEIPFPLYFNSNGAPTRIASSNNENIALSPKKVIQFIYDSYTQDGKHAAAAHFSLPFGMCALAYFNPEKENKTDLPLASLNLNQPNFNTKKQGKLNGAIQLSAAAYYQNKDVHISPDPYFHGSALQVAITSRQTVHVKIPVFFFDIEYDMEVENSILGIPITRQFNAEFFGAYKNNEKTISEYSVNAKVPLKRIDFSGYGASIFSNWFNNRANFGRVSQVHFTVMMGRTAHEVVQIKSFIVGFCIPVVRSIIMQRQNHGLVTRYDTGWVATGPGKFNYILNPVNGAQNNTYEFHPGVVREIDNVRSIRDTSITLMHGSNQLAGVYFDGDILLENIEKGFISGKQSGNESYVASKGQFGYVLLCDASKVTDSTKLEDIFPATDFQAFLNRPDVGSIGGPVDCVMNVAGSDQRMHVTRIDISASNSAALFPVAAQGTLELPKEGSWSVVKCLSNSKVVQLGTGETVSLIRHGKLSFNNSDTGMVPVVNYLGSRYIIGNPDEIAKYAVAEPVNLDLQYGLLQTTPTQKILFNRPMFAPGAGPVVNGVTGGIPQLFTDTPRLADAFKLLSTNSIFPAIGDAFSLPNGIKALDVVNLTGGYTFPDDVVGQLTNFASPNFDALKKLFIVNEEAFKIYIVYDGGSAASPFSLDLSSDTPGRKNWEMINAKVSIVVEVGTLAPLLTVQGNFHAEYGKEPLIEGAKLLWGGDEALQNMVEILEVLSKLNNLGGDKPDAFEEGLKFVPTNAPDSWNYKCSIEKSIPVIQFPSIEMITLSGPPPVIIEAALTIGVFFSLSLNPDPKALVKAGAGVTFGFEGTMQIMLITLEFATVYGAGSAKVRIFIDIQNPVPEFDYTCGFGASIAVQLPVVGVVSVTRSVSLTGDISEKKLLLMAGTLLRGVLSLAGGLLMTSIQIEGAAGVIREGGDEIKARIELTFSLNVSLAFIISYDFTEKFTDDIPFNKIIP